MMYYFIGIDMCKIRQRTLRLNLSLILFLVIVINCSVLSINALPLDRNRISISSSEIDGNSCPIVPEILVVSYRRKGFVPNTILETELIPKIITDYIQAPETAFVELECISRSPVEWTFDGVNNPPARLIDILRKSEENPLQSCYVATILVETNKRVTGRYWCKTVDGIHNKKIYIYGQGNKPSHVVLLCIKTFNAAAANHPPLLLNHGKTIKVIADGSPSVVLPCETVNPQVPPKLFKGISNTKEIQDLIPFNPEVGFILDLKSISKPFDTYKCQGTSDLVTINVLEAPEFQISPKFREVVVLPDKIVTLTCKSKNPIEFQGSIDGNRVIINETDGSEYKYVISYTFLGTKSSKVTCLDQKTKVVHHTWNCIVISTELDTARRIFYDKSSDRFICRSMTNQPPAIAIAQCNHPINCKFARKCFTWDASYTIEGEVRNASCGPIYPGMRCNEDDLVQFDSTATSCSYVQNSFEAGVVHCSFSGEDDQELYYFKGLDNQGQRKVITHWNEVSSDELIKIAIPDRPLYFGESVTFECTTTKFLFARGFKWMFHLNNGTYMTPTVQKNRKTEDDIADYDLDNDTEKSTISESITLKIDSTEIGRIVCIVPFWDTENWLNTSNPVTIQIGARPNILNKEGKESSVDFPAGTNQSVLCKANGIPPPHIRWIRIDKKIDETQTSKLFEDSTNTSNRWLNLGFVDEDDEGDYICIASNVLGITSHRFRLSITQSANVKGKFLLIVSIIFFACFTSIVLVLWKKLRKNQNLLDKLMSTKDYLAFRNGDKVALHKVLHTSEGYIRAEYLRYDADYEIQEENLVIDTEKVLGEGEFGLVLEGKLRRNNDEKVVAVKTTRGSDTGHFKALLSELKILTYIGWHDNVINLLGAVTRNLKYHDVYVVVEYCHLGSMEKYLRNNKNTYLHQINDDIIDLNIEINPNQLNSSGYVAKNFTVSTEDLLKWCHQVTSGMEYLANKRVIHGDLAARNILLTADRTAKITDFGLSIQLYNDCSNDICHKEGPLPWKWLAPEILQYNNFSTQSDVWAFGVTLWEIFSLGETPYPGLSCNTDFRNRLYQGYRMEIPAFANTRIYEKILECWQAMPNQRPSFIGLRRFFYRLLHNSTDQIFPPMVPHASNLMYLDPLNLVHLTNED